MRPIVFVTLIGAYFVGTALDAGQLRAGVARVEITDHAAGPVNDPLYVKALVLKDDATTAAIITVDAVAIGTIGRIPNSYLANVRSHLQTELGIPPAGVVINASHCHGAVCADIEQRTIQAVREAGVNLVPVRVGAGTGREERISENRRYRLKDGRETDARRAYALPPDEEVAAIGPIDPDIGLLRLDRADGRPFAVVYVFACHPIMGVPNGGNTADYPGFASRLIEQSLGEGTMAFFVQGCGGDINPLGYKDVHRPHDAERLGNLLGLRVLEALKTISTTEPTALKLVSDVLNLPRAADYAQRIAKAEAEQQRLLGSLKGTNVDLKSFLALLVQQRLAGAYPSADVSRYLHEKAMGKNDLEKLDKDNQADTIQYIQNIQIMEELTRLQTNVALLRMHQAEQAAAGTSALDVEITALQVGAFRLVTFPGELTVEIGLRLEKAAARPFTFVAGCTNGYIFYAPTAEQRRNPGFAQEDCDCLLAPEWEKHFTDHVISLLGKF